MLSLGMTSPTMIEIAKEFDKIGWTDTLHGRLPRALHRFQNVYCINVNSRSTGTDWMRALVGKLLTISHTQWLYRNFSLHNKVNGHLRLTHQTEVLEEIARLSTTKPEDIPEESRFLLEVEMVRLDSTSLAYQEYWITAMTAAHSAGRRCSRPRTTANRQRETNPNLNPRVQHNIHLFQRRIKSILQQMRDDLDLSYGSWRLKRRQEDAEVITNGSNKRLRKPDYGSCVMFALLVYRRSGGNAPLVAAFQKTP
jgi:hypothetical protein